jgi:cytochrome c556
MSDQQAEIDADVAELQADDASIEAEIAKLQAANPALDLTGLKAAIAATSAIAPPSAP